MVGVWIRVDNIRSFVDKCVVNQNAVYLYFEIVRQIKPERIIDVGMFLKRIGAVSRQAMGMEIGRNVELCGIDAMPECSAGVYGTIYDRIWSIEEFAENEGTIESDEGNKKAENVEDANKAENVEGDKKADNTEVDKKAENIENAKKSENAEGVGNIKKKCTLAFMLRAGACLDDYDEKRIVSRIAREASYLVTDDACYERNKELLSLKSCRELTLDDDKYKIVIF